MHLQQHEHWMFITTSTLNKERCDKYSVQYAQHSVEKWWCIRLFRTISAKLWMNVANLNDQWFSLAILTLFSTILLISRSNNPSIWRKWYYFVTIRVFVIRNSPDSAKYWNMMIFDKSLLTSYELTISKLLHAIFRYIIFPSTVITQVHYISIINDHLVALAFSCKIAATRLQQQDYSSKITADDY